jgi:hypothetical protein
MDDVANFRASALSHPGRARALNTLTIGMAGRSS